MPKPAKRHIAAALALLAVGVSAGSVAAQDRDAGRRLAMRWCISCHIVVPGADGSDAAPPFETIANDPHVSERGLRAWLAEPHPPMPNLHLSRMEIDDVIAYLESLKVK